MTVWFAAIAALGAWPAAARAQAGTVGVDWAAPADCPTASDVEASIQALLGRAPRLPDGRHLEVKARAERKRDRWWSATVETRVGTTIGSRTFATESCRAAADATALIVALMIDPEAVAAHAPPSAVPLAGAPVPAVSASVVAAPASPAAEERAPPATAFVAETAISRAPQPPPRPGPAPRLSAGATIAIDRGTLPRPTYGAGARVGAKLGPHALELGLLVSAAASATIAGTAPPAGGSFRFWAASLSACPAVAVRRVDLGACAAIELDEVTGTGFGVTSSYENSARWLALGGGALARLHATRHVGVLLRIDAVAPLGPPTFFIKGVPEAEGRVYSPARVTGRALAAVDVDF